MQGSARKDVVFGQRGCILSPYQGQNGNPGYNGSDHALSLKDLKVRFITADREGLEPLTEEDLTYFQPSTKPKERPAYLPPIPGLGGGRLKKGPLAKPEISQRAFKAPIVPPQSSASGFFYYMTGRDPDPVPGGSVYLSGVRAWQARLAV